ncbi:ATPase [bacterium]|nr:ATPase [bacterium]|tara:strand:- start:60 stop:1052 length:993 start_codon:yes stop_codon:yes gene_type:complete
MATETLAEINSRVEKESAFVTSILSEAKKVIAGQTNVIEKLLVGVLAEGHVLLEGVPGLAKTLTIKTLSNITDSSFSRIQFTPDLLPSDIIGTLMFNQSKNDFIPKLGPIFANFILADEINRAPAKVQSALLEAMQERQVTLGDKTYPLHEPFLVLATQNPIDQEGTYSLPEAQIDRFMLKITVSYPKKEDEKLIIERMSGASEPTVNKLVTSNDILKAREVVKEIYFDEKVKEYVLDIVHATRTPNDYNLQELSPLIQYGASPRASIALIKAAKAHAFIQGRGFVTPEDIKAIGKDVLRHRIIPSFEAEAENITSDNLVDKIFSQIEVP